MNSLRTCQSCGGSIVEPANDEIHCVACYLRQGLLVAGEALLGEATPEDHHALAQAGDIQVRYHIPEVAQAWRRLMGSSVVERTDSEASLRAQSKVVGAGFARQRVTGGVRVPPLQYRTLDAATSRLVLQRALDEGRSL